MNTFKHSGGHGDLILGLPTVIAIGGGTFYLHRPQARAINRLLEVQPYIKNIVILDEPQWEAMEVTHNLDLFRHSSNLSVARMHLDAFKVTFDLSQQWLFNIAPKLVAKIIIHDTGIQRWPGNTVNWNLLKGHEKECVFIGFDSDYLLFKKYKNLDIPYYKTEDLYEVAQIIAGANLFIGNQSAPYTIAEGLKKTLVLDLSMQRPQFPFGSNGYCGLGERHLNEL
jgi:hypothetical protein